nr:MAG TPA_asm: hypothetical protein [Caudoviricetes sp.]
MSGKLDFKPFSRYRAFLLYQQRQRTEETYPRRLKIEL